MGTFGKGDDAELDAVLRFEVARREGGAHAQQQAPVRAPRLLIRAAEQVEALPPVRQRKDLRREGHIH